MPQKCGALPSGASPILVAEPGGVSHVVDLVRYRPMQLCIFLKALVGAERMQEMKIEAIAHAKQVP